MSNIDNLYDSIDNDRMPDINYHEFLHFERKSTVAVERQITVSRYRTRTAFDFDRVHRALEICQLTAVDEIGMIDLLTSRLHSQPDNMIEESNTDSEQVGDWIRSLFGIVGEKRFRFYDFKTTNIYDGLLSGTLNDSFLIEFYADKRNELRFLTYGGGRYDKKITDKLRECFDTDLYVDRVHFDYEDIREIITRYDFIRSLKSIEYSPEGEDDYGTVDQASISARYHNIIDPDAQRIKEILENPKILIRSFGARSSLFIDKIREDIQFRFELTSRGTVTIYLPEFSFLKPMQDVEFENEFYNVVRQIYTFIVGSTPTSSPDVVPDDKLPGQLAMNFIKGMR